MFLKSFFHIVVEKSFNIVKNKRATAGKKANKKQVCLHLSGVQKAVVSFANMFERNRRINRDAQRVIKRKTPQKVRTLLYGKRGRRIEERFFCAVCGNSYGEGWRYKLEEDTYLYLCSRCKEVVRPQLTVKAIYSSNFEVQRKKH